MSEENQRVFNPREHLMQLKSKEGEKDYLPVQWRLVWFRDLCPNGTIKTEMVHLDLTQAVTKEVSVWNSEKRRSDKVLKEMPGIAIFKATVEDGNGGVATGYGSESALDFGDFIEKAETKAIGRALAALGYGTQFAPELEEGARIVDAPVDRTPANGNGSNSVPPNNNTPEPAPKELIAKARKMYQDLGRPEPPDLDKKSAHVLREAMNQMAGKYRDLLNAKNGHAPTSTANAPDVKALRKRCAQMQPSVNFEQLVIKVLKENKPDDNITPDEQARLKQALDNVEEVRAKRAAQQPERVAS